MDDGNAFVFEERCHHVLVVGEHLAGLAFWHVARLFPRAIHRRRLIMGRRRISDAELAKWFAFRPAAIPLDEAAEAGAAGAPLRAAPLPAADYVA